MTIFLKGKVLEMNEYEINTQTLAIIPINKNKSKIIEKNKVNDETDKNEEKLANIIRKELEIFLLELGCGYTYVGKEVRMGESYCDLLFFNYEFNCFVVIELKTRKIKKEDIGQLEYYINYVDENMKKESFNPTIGVLVAKEGNYLVMKYCTNKNIYKTTYKIINEKQKL